jgi:hypothetical protein
MEFYDAKQTLFAHRIWCNTRRFHTVIKMPLDQNWEQNIHTTIHKRSERNLAENLAITNLELNQENQYFSQNLKPKTNNCYTIVCFRLGTLTFSLFERLIASIALVGR